MDSLLKSTHHAGRGEAGRLSVGFYTSISAGNLRATLVDYQKRFSQIDICLKESSRMRLVTALRNGGLDIAIVTGDLPLLGSQSMSLWSERILWRCSKNIHWLEKTSYIGPTSAARRCCSVNMIRAVNLRTF
jgi:DNA-binding transcriptional LysR family regulator